MANPENLVPFTSDQSREEAAKNGKKGGIASGESRREKKKRGEMWKELVNTEVTNPKMLANLKALGITDEHPTYERYIKATAMKDLVKNAKMKDVVMMDDELYGKLDNKTQLELSGEIKKVVVEIKDFSKKGVKNDNNATKNSEAGKDNG